MFPINKKIWFISNIMPTTTAAEMAIIDTQNILEQSTVDIATAVPNICSGPK